MVNVEHLSQESFIRLLKLIIDDIGIRKIYFSQQEPIRKGPITLMNQATLDIPLSGKKHISFAHDQEILATFLNPGEIHFAPAMHWKKPLWDSLHEMSSIIYHPDYVRLTYINFDDLSTSYQDRPADIFYHTSIPLDIAGDQILRILTLMAVNGDETGGQELLKALLKITLKTLENDTTSFASKAQKTYMQMKKYLQDNFTSPINRAHVANIFQLNPSYVSRLFNNQGSESFNAMLRRLRLEHAAILLKQTNLTIGEITDACGYLSSTYFIAAFHKHFGISPGKYRNLT